MRFLVGEQTQRLLEKEGRFSLRAVDRVAAKGKAHAMTLYEVLDAEEPGRRELKEATRATLDEARALFAHRAFAESRRLLSEARVVDPNDGVLSVLAERCRRYELDPPPADWHGVEALDSK